MTIKAAIALVIAVLLVIAAILKPTISVYVFTTILLGVLWWYVVIRMGLLKEVIKNTKILKEHDEQERIQIRAHALQNGERIDNKEVIRRQRVLRKYRKQQWKKER